MARTDRKMTTARPSRFRGLTATMLAALAVLPFGAAVAEPEVSAASAGAVAVPVEAMPVVQPIPVQDSPASVLATRTLGSGVASFYGAELHGRRTASGERFDMHALTAAHRTLPFGTRVLVTNPANGQSVTVRINDRGPFHGGRVIDLSRAAATEIGLVARGHGRVELSVIDN